MDPEFSHLLNLTPTKNKTKINGRLPQDSLIQIWARLPLNTLYKFRSVCKLWNSTISSDPLLSSLRHDLSPFLSPPPNLILFLNHTPNEPIKVPDRPVQFSVRPIEDVVAHDRDPGLNRVKNGFTPYVDHSLDLLPSKGPLVCFASFEYFYLCNPSTQEFLRIPRSRGGGCGLTTASGFGYLAPENRYVLARFSGAGVELLEFGPGSAGSASWRTVEPKPPCPPEGFGLMVDGSFYWKVARDSGSGDSFVLCLDTKEEKYGVMPRPEGNENEVILYDQLYLVEFKGSLCAIDNFSRPPRMEIWVLNRNEWEFSWVRKYRIFISGMDRDLVYPFCDYEGENGGEMVLCNGTRSRLYCYNLKNRSIKQVYKPKHRTSDRLAVYTPGLFPLSVDG